jgi:hypothetical protein
MSYTYPAPLSAKDVWTYPTRTLTTTKFPFWSAIILQTRGSVSVPANTTVNVVIQPPSGETWLVWIDASIERIISHVRYSDFDGTTARIHVDGTNPRIGVLKILTDTLYARLTFYNDTSYHTQTAYYGYSGFKLSKPHWVPQRLDTSTKQFKRSTDLPLPDPIKPLNKYKALILGLDPSKPNDYALGIILEEDTPLAIDQTGFPVERKSVYISADALTNLVMQFKSGKIDYVKAGFEPYLKKWKAEGIDLGVV